MRFAKCFSRNRVCIAFQQYDSETGYTPLPFKSEVPTPQMPSTSKASQMPSTDKASQMPKMKARPAKQKGAAETALHNKNVISSIIAEKAKLCKEVKLQKCGGKTKPKLKAEVKVKSSKDKEQNAPQLEEPDSTIENIKKVTDKTVFFCSVHFFKIVEKEETWWEFSKKLEKGVTRCLSSYELYVYNF